MNGDAIFRVAKLTGPTKLLAAARHNRRAIPAEVRRGGPIDSARSRFNEVLHGPGRAVQIVEHANAMMQAAGVLPLRKDAVVALEVVCSLPVGSSVDDKAYFVRCMNWAAGQFGGLLNILSVDVHRDESASHAHILILPLSGGRMRGSAMMGSLKDLRERQDSFYREVAAPFGLSRPPRRLSGSDRDAAAKTVVRALMATGDLATRSRVWSEIRASIQADPRPWATAIGIVLTSSDIGSQTRVAGDTAA